jgi:hypothetical protein
MTISDQELRRNQDVKIHAGNQPWLCSLFNGCPSRDPLIKLDWDASWKCKLAKEEKTFGRGALQECLNANTTNLAGVNATTCLVSKEEYNCENMFVTSRELYRDRNVEIKAGNQTWSCTLSDECRDRNPLFKRKYKFDASWNCIRKLVTETPKMEKKIGDELLKQCLNANTTDVAAEKTFCYFSMEQFNCKNMTITDRELRRNQDVKLRANNQFWSCSLTQECDRLNLKIVFHNHAYWTCTRQTITATQVGKEKFLEKCLSGGSSAEQLASLFPVFDRIHIQSIFAKQGNATSKTCPVSPVEFNCNTPEDHKNEILKNNQDVKIEKGNQKWVCSLAHLCDGRHSQGWLLVRYWHDASWTCKLVTEDPNQEFRNLLEDCLQSKKDLKEARCNVNGKLSNCSDLKVSVEGKDWQCKPKGCTIGLRTPRIRPWYNCTALPSLLPTFY